MAQGIMVIFASLPIIPVFLLLIVVAAQAYFLGCFNGAVVVSKYILQDDVRDHGSGNAGLTNFYRTFGGKLTLVVIAADVIKMLIAVFLGNVLFSVVLPEVPVFVRYWSGLFCALGHMFPVMFQFRGGKGILSGGALVLMLDWRIALATWSIFILIVALTRLVSLASCCTSVILPITSALVYRSPSVFLVALMICALILWQHRGNILRLLHGKETKFYFKKKQVKS
ncbi:MAG: Acyl-phosphate:glycerol-3-phosphate O-acyltransferase PlsY [Evtepia sp.]|jgi:glycerol-3-phosphate acyltransferase PlsY|nr:Acyl-phosphate:glycerol-3-phosphate O-acyltransferase PlsY [Evtepia sp.]